KSIPKEWWLLLALYLATRLTNLMVLPVFLDEARHIRVVQHLDLAQDFLSPLQHDSPKLVLDWITAGSLTLLPDPVASARIGSVAAGALGILGLYLVGKDLYSARIASLAAALYVISPLMLFHERMLLADVMLNTCGLYVLLFSLLVLNKGGAIHGVALGMFMALAVLSKLPGAFYLIVPLVVWALLHRTKVRALAVRILPAYCTAALILAPVLLHPLGARLFNEIALKTIATSEAPTISGWVSLFVHNAAEALPGVGAYLTLPVVVVCALSLVLALALRNKQGLLLWATGAVPVVALLGSSSGFLPPRYFLFAASPVLLCAAWSIDRLSRAAPPLLCRAGLFRSQTSLLRRATTAVCLSLLVAISLQAAKFDYYVVTHPSQAPLPRIDRLEYIQGWSSGYGIPEAVRWFRNRAMRQQLAVITDPSDIIGLDGLLIYLHDNSRITTLGENLEEPVQATALGAETYVVLGSVPHPDFQLLNPSAELVASYPKPGGWSVVEIYAVANPVAVPKISVMVVDAGLGGSVGVGGLTPPRWGEEHAGEFMWLGQGDREGIRAFLWSDREVEVELAFDVAPGPGRLDARRTVELTLENESALQTERQQFEGTTTVSFVVQLQPGRNDFVFRCLDRATVPKQPNGDTRPLLVRLDAIGVASPFNRLEAGPSDSPLLRLDPALKGVVGVLPHLETAPWGVEMHEADSLLWLGQGDEEGIQAVLWSDQRLVVDLAFDVAPGPGRPDDLRTVYLAVENESGAHRQDRTLDAPTTLNLTVELVPGRNALTFGCLDEATVLEQPNGDTRPLLVLLREVRVSR
ncbi:MAG TPA: phospholipid carrier-dependent glycosyltransferase, partial [Chloroflexi bacterium]|nr:phospholipid carrier-dependent glycosyltransferase [Chloroflexota bacterium]